MQYDNMFQGSIGGPVMQHDGAVHTGKGKYRLQFLGSDNPKEITRSVTITAVAVVLVIILIATFLGGKMPNNPPYEVELVNSIGRSLEETALKIGVDFSEMTEIEKGVFCTNEHIELDGVDFELYFYEKNGLLSGFAYIADYQADTKEAAKDICNTFINWRLTEFVPNGETQPVNVSLKYLREELNKEQQFSLWNTSVLTTEYPNDPINQYIKDLEDSDEWEGRVGEYVVKKGELYLDKGCDYNPQTQMLRLELSYKIEPKRETIA